MGTPTGSAAVPRVDPRHHFRDEERSATGRPCPSSSGHPEPIVSSVGCPLYTFYGTSPADDPPGENEPLVVLHLPVADPTRRFRFRLWGRATPFSKEIIFVSLCGAPVYPFRRNMGSPPEVELGCGDPISNSAFVRRVRRPSDSTNLL